MQRIANPWTSVRLRDAPPFATLAQLVERNLAKVEVTSSNLVCRSKLFRYGNCGISMLKASNKNQRKLVFLYLNIRKQILFLFLSRDL